MPAEVARAFDDVGDVSDAAMWAEWLARYDWPPRLADPIAAGAPEPETEADRIARITAEIARGS